jgi:hypothetical protein
MKREYTMAYAIDLSPRQTTRTLEQAVRHQAETIIQPRIWADDQALNCRLINIETPKGWRSRRQCLVLEPVDETSEETQESLQQIHPDEAQINSLIGTYCDISLQLGENRYLFCADVIAVLAAHEESTSNRLFLSRPEQIQVAQRRRFWRFRPAQSSRVDLSWTNSDETTGEGIGWLCNVSADGLACRVGSKEADLLGIGEEIKLSFCLAPGDQKRFAIDAVLCSKMPAGTEGAMILGLQFLTNEDHPTSACHAKQLGQQLLARYTPVLDASEGADL